MKKNTNKDDVNFTGLYIAATVCTPFVCNYHGDMGIKWFFNVFLANTFSLLFFISMAYMITVSVTENMRPWEERSLVSKILLSVGVILGGPFIMYCLIL